MDSGISRFQDFADTAVPQHLGPRFGWLYMTNVEAAITICAPVFMLGASLGQSLSGPSFLIALAVSGLALALLSSWSSFIGTQTRLSTALLVERSFGVMGAKVVWAIIACAMFGWFGVQTEFFAKSFLQLMATVAPEIKLNPTLTIIVSGLVMSSTAIFGIKSIGKLAQISIPFLLGTLAYAFWVAFEQNGLGKWWSYQPLKPMATSEAIAVTVGAFSLAAICMPDIKRFSIDVTHSLKSAVASLGFFYPFFLLIVGILSVLTGEPDFMKLLVVYGLGSISILMLMMATWTTNDINLYCASLSLARLFPKQKRVWLTLVAAIIGTSLATLGVFEHLMPLFSLLGVFTTPLLAIYGLDNLFKAPAETRAFNASAFTCWIAASAVGVATTPTSQWGFGLVTLSSVPGVDSLIVSLALYAAYKTLKSKS